MFSCGQTSQKAIVNTNSIKVKSTMTNPDTATFAMGCFWCSEAIFQNLKGVNSVQSGYSGGTKVNPTYREVCTGETGHAEAIQVVYDTTKISYKDLLEVFWSSHDPTTLNRQGADEGTQYRSAVFYNSDEQKNLAEIYKKKLDESHAYSNKIVTEITPYTNFFKAEDYHKDYFLLHGDEPYCTHVIAPKVEKFKKVFKDKLKQ
jgi:peptide-methionine (S)-S-oxide reductase